jgi:hypothetical protein
MNKRSSSSATKAGGLADLASYVSRAKVDYRDVLSWAEHPSEGKLPLFPSDSDRVAAQKRDQEQYLRWIAHDRKGKG